MNQSNLTSYVAFGMRSEGNDPKRENQQFVSTSRQCTSTPVGFDQGLLSKEQCDNTVVSPTLPDLVPADLYLFRPLKSALKGRRFPGANDIIKNAAEELKRLSQNGFLVRFQQLYNR
jgi:hypothetical protein